MIKRKYCSYKIFKTGIILKKVHRVIQFNQKAWLKPYIEMNTDLRKNAKNNFEKIFVRFLSVVTNLISLCFLNIFHSLSKNRIIQTLKKNKKLKMIFDIFLNSVLMLIYGFNHAF